jgi:hypothetical protein
MHSEHPRDAPKVAFPFHRSTSSALFSPARFFCAGLLLLPLSLGVSSIVFALERFDANGVGIVEYLIIKLLFIRVVGKFIKRVRPCARYCIHSGSPPENYGGNEVNRP